jgi:hypothetical protein
MRVGFKVNTLCRFAKVARNLKYVGIVITKVLKSCNDGISKTMKDLAVFFDAASI